MGQTFEIIPQSSSVSVQAGQTVKTTFTLTNTKPEAIDVQVSLDTGTPEPLPWVALAAPGLRSVGPKEVQTIELTLAPPADHADDVVSVKVVVASTSNPEADWATSPGLRVQVGKGDGPAWKKWLPLVLGLVVILGVGIGLAVWLSGRGPEVPKVGQACDGTKPCPEGLVCTNTGPNEKVCLAENGTACVANEDCRTGFCDGEKTACAAAPVHSPCDGGQKCFPGQSCHELGGRQLCSWDPGEPCAEDLECVSAFCKDKICKAYSGSCQADGDCRGTEKCVGGACLLKDGQACADNVACASGDCEAGKCKAPDQQFTGRCQDPCPPGQVCHPRLGCVTRGRPPKVEVDADALKALIRAAKQTEERVKASSAINARRAAAVKKVVRER